VEVFLNDSYNLKALGWMIQVIVTIMQEIILNNLTVKKKYVLILPNEEVSF